MLVGSLCFVQRLTVDFGRSWAFVTLLYLQLPFI